MVVFRSVRRISFCVLIAFGLSKAEHKLVSSSGFENIRTRAKVSADFLLITEHAASESKCLLSCNKNKNCRSVNFCDGNICEINKEDIYSTAHAESILQLDENCKYYGMKKNSAPLCVRDGIHVDIQSNATTEDCRHGTKRVDREWGPRGSKETLINSSTEWKEVSRREILVQEAHDGVIGEENLEKPITWLKFVKKKWPSQKRRKIARQWVGNCFPIWMGLGISCSSCWRRRTTSGIGWASRQKTGKFGKVWTEKWFQMIC